MVKKGFLFVLLLLLTAAVALVWFVQNKSKSISTDPFSVIPDDACFVIESSELPDFLNSITDGNRLFSSLEKVKEAGPLCLKIRNLRNFANTKGIRDLFEKNNVLISYHPSPGGSFTPLLCMNVIQKSKYKELIDALKPSGGKIIAIRKIKGVSVTPVIFETSEGTDTLLFAFRSGLALCSSSEAILGRAISQKQSSSDIRKIPGFTRIMSAAGKNEDKIYIVFSNFSTLLSKITGTKAASLPQRFAHLASCAEADIHINENGLILSGYTESTDSTDYLYSYRARETSRLTSSEVLPADVLMFETLLLKNNSLDQSGIKNTDSLTSALAYAIAPYVGNEITRALIDQGDGGVSAAGVVIYKLTNPQMAEEIFTENEERWATAAGLEKADYMRYFQPDEQTKLSVYNTPFHNLSFAFASGFVPFQSDSVYVFADNWLVTGNSFEAVKKVLYNNILNRTLANDITYRDFESTMPSRAGYYFYCQPSGIIKYLSSMMTDTLAGILSSNVQLLRKIQAAGYQFAASNNMIYNTLSLSFADSTKEKSGAEWETLLDTTASIKPFFFTNHNTGAREIFVQDFKNNVYLINAAGRVLWKVSPGEKIIGNIFMIDYFRNGKYQLLFAGKNWLYLLDRNGNFVERFPSKLRSPASGPPALFDYDGTGEYRILIPGEDRQIYAYDKSGNVVRGWKPYKTAGLVRTEIRFYRISGKDYLVAADDKTVYFLDRTGNERLRLKEPAVKAAHSEIRLDNSNYPGIVFSSPEGIITRITFDGTVTKTAIRKFSVDHSFDFFDIDGDGFGEYVFIDKGILYLYDNNKSELFTRDFGSLNLEGPVFFIFSNSDRKIGITDTGKKLIYLVDKNGDNVPGFPLKGASVFSIGKLSESGNFRLIVGGEDNFLYNYKIENVH